ncbi:hypothetical protein MAR_004834, partial [Mya arenaria]
MFPTIRRDAKGSVILTDTRLARLVKSEKREWAKPEKYEEVKIAARCQCREAGGDDNQPKQWMGFLRMQWGSFRGETYRWLLENTPGYFGWLINKLKQDKLSPSDHLFLFKMTLIKYASMFPEGNEIVAIKEKKKKANKSERFTRKYPKCANIIPGRVRGSNPHHPPVLFCQNWELPPLPVLSQIQGRESLANMGGEPHHHSWPDLQSFQHIKPHHRTLGLTYDLSLLVFLFIRDLANPDDEALVFLFIGDLANPDDEALVFLFKGDLANPDDEALVFLFKGDLANPDDEVLVLLFMGDLASPDEGVLANPDAEVLAFLFIGDLANPEAEVLGFLFIGDLANPEAEGLVFVFLFIGDLANPDAEGLVLAFLFIGDVANPDDEAFMLVFPPPIEDLAKPEGKTFSGDLCEIKGDGLSAWTDLLTVKLRILVDLEDLPANPIVAGSSFWICMPIYKSKFSECKLMQTKSQPNVATIRIVMKNHDLQCSLKMYYPSFPAIVPSFPTASTSSAHHIQLTENYNFKRANQRKISPISVWGTLDRCGASGDIRRIITRVACCHVVGEKVNCVVLGAISQIGKRNTGTRANQRKISPISVWGTLGRCGASGDIRRIITRVACCHVVGEEVNCVVLGAISQIGKRNTGA